MRQKIAEHMVLSKRTSAHVTTVHRVDMTQVARLRARAKEEFRERYGFGLTEDGYGWEKLFSERMCRHFMEDFRLYTRVARFHNVYGPWGTWFGGREKAPAAICRKVIEAKLTRPARD